jgi:hypothetical protein
MLSLQGLPLQPMFTLLLPVLVLLLLPVWPSPQT